MNPEMRAFLAMYMQAFRDFIDGAERGAAGRALSSG